MNPVALPSVQPFSPRTSTILRRSWDLSPAGFRRPHLVLRRCGGAAAGQSSRDADEAVGEMLGERVEELLKKEENRFLLEGLEKASRRVDLARSALADIERQEAEALRVKERVVRELRSREFEIVETQKELLKARAIVEESKESLSYKNSEFSQKEVFSIEIERWESIKAASISSIVGTLASLPLSMIQTTTFSALALHTTVVFICCALFGVTFRYTIRGDIDNFQLKTGTSTAFGFVKGLAELEAGKPLELNTDSFVSHFTDGAVFVSENIFIFLSAAVALDFCFKFRLLTFGQKL